MGSWTQGMGIGRTNTQERGGSESYVYSPIVYTWRGVTNIASQIACVKRPYAVKRYYEILVRLRGSFQKV